jgi:Ecdysteroid kinase-like family
MSELLTQKYKWINHSFFDRILKKKHSTNDSIMVLGYTIDEALGKGENYSSHMLRTSVRYLYSGEFRTDQLIVKASLCDDTMQSMVDEFFVFERELTAYRDVLPRAEKLLRSIGDSTQLAAT